MMRAQDMEKSKRRNESVQQGRQDQPHVTEPLDVSAPAGLGIDLATGISGNQSKGDLSVSHRPEDKENKAINNCQVDAETKESLLKHLDEHGAVSLLTSAKFGQYTGCVLEEIERAIAAESVVIASAAAAGDSTGNQDGTASTADEATASPAAMRIRLQTGRRMISYRQGRS